MTACKCPVTAAAPELGLHMWSCPLSPSYRPPLPRMPARWTGRDDDRREHGDPRDDPPARGEA